MVAWRSLLGERLDRFDVHNYEIGIWMILFQWKRGDLGFKTMETPYNRDYLGHNLRCGMSVEQGVLPFKIESAKAGHLTSFSGVPLVVELCRRVFGRKVYRSLASRLGMKSNVVRRYVESLMCLFASGGDCIEDIERLRLDPRVCVFTSSTSQVKSSRQAGSYCFGWPSPPWNWHGFARLGAPSPA